jgi:hypothetical protein
VPSMERRGTETWSAESDIFVTQAGFPWGRVTLPGEAAVGADGEPQERTGTPFADPARFSNLALLYSNLAVSDVVRNTLPNPPAREQVQTSVLDATGNGMLYLPIIKITTLDATAEGAVQLNRDVIGGLTRYLENQQRDVGTPSNERVQISLLNRPKGAALVTGRSLTVPLFALLFCVLAAIAAAHILENIRPRHSYPSDIVDPESLFASANGHGSAYEEEPLQRAQR